MKTIPLTPIDHVFTGVGAYPIEFLFSYPNRMDPARLQSSLDAALECFWPLGCELFRLSEHSYGLRPRSGGPSFEVTQSSTVFEDPESSYEFLNPVESVEGRPLARIKLTETPGGSVLGVSISHALVDGFSYFHFLSSWSRICRGRSIIEPSHQRELLIPENSEHRERITPDEVLARAGLFWGGRREDLAREAIRWETLFLSRSKIEELLAEARKESEFGLTHNDVIAAYLWKKYVFAWSEGEDNQATYVSCPFDFRRMLRGLPRNYFGCAVSLSTAGMSYEDLGCCSLGRAASTVHRAIGKVGRDYARGSLELLESLRRQEGLEVVERLHVAHPRRGMLVTNISRHPVGGLDFGVGPPSGYRILTPAGRAAVILPADDGVEIRVCHSRNATPV